MFIQLPEVEVSGTRAVLGIEDQNIGNSSGGPYSMFLVLDTTIMSLSSPVGERLQDVTMKKVAAEELQSKTQLSGRSRAHHHVAVSINWWSFCRRPDKYSPTILGHS